jgi:hypothetical protein
MAVAGHRGGVHAFDVGGVFPVAQLAEVVVAGRTAAGKGGPLPAGEDVTDGLHQMLAGDDTLALVVVFALAGVAGQHRALGLSSSQHI